MDELSINTMVNLRMLGFNSGSFTYTIISLVVPAGVWATIRQNIFIENCIIIKIIILNFRRKF